MREGMVEIAAIGRGEAVEDADEAFHARFEAVRDRLTAICRTVVGDEDADDVVQETYLRARSRIGQLRKPTALEAWLVRIALNEARSVARRRARHQQPLGALDPPARSQDRDVALLELVDALPLRERMTVVLYYGYGYGLAEVAGMVGISHINARTVLFRARRRLRQGMGGQR
jgi:RNA polymerase sigma-70 factor (ECF subfamily)